MNNNRHKLVSVTPLELQKIKSPRYIRSSVILPSQYHAYSVCTEFAKDWFLEKFPDKYFNSIFVNGKHSFDEFKKFSTIDDKLKRTNPLLAIVPDINNEHNREWIDSMPSIPMAIRRSKIDDSFFNDYTNNLHLQIMFKTILMTFTYKVRLDTRAEQLDMLEFIKLNHRAGWTETRDIDLDIHVPRTIIAQIAQDIGLNVLDNLEVENPQCLLKYLNSNSLIPFIYKYRCSTGNNEFFLKVPNCVAHIKAELPSKDDGERDNLLTTNFSIEFNIEIEMTAPYLYTYFSQCEQKFLSDNIISTDKVSVMMAHKKTIIPQKDQNKWDLMITTEYLVEEEDLNKPLEIDFNEYFKQTDLKEIIEYCKRMYINPAVFINFKFFNDTIERAYQIDWNYMKCTICNVTNLTTVIAIYCDKEFINNYLISKQDNNSRIN